MTDKEEIKEIPINIGLYKIVESFQKTLIKTLNVSYNHLDNEHKMETSVNIEYKQMYIEIIETTNYIRSMVMNYGTLVDFNTVREFCKTFVCFIKDFWLSYKDVTNTKKREVYLRIICRRYFSNSVNINTFSQEIGNSDLSENYFLDRLNEKIDFIYDEVNIYGEDNSQKADKLVINKDEKIFEEIESDSVISHEKQGSQIKEFKTTFNGKTQIMKVPNKFDEEETYNIICQLIDDNPNLSAMTMKGFNLDLLYLQQQILLAKDRWYGLGYSLGDLYFHGWDAEHSKKMYVMHKEIDKRLKELYALTVIGLDDDMQELWSKEKYTEKTDD